MPVLSWWQWWCIHHHVGMAGKDELSNAILGGASDYISDIGAKVVQWYQAKDEDKVICLYICNCVNCVV